MNNWVRQDPGSLMPRLQDEINRFFGKNRNTDAPIGDTGPFYRRFVLPDTVDSDNVNAAWKDGVVTVTIPNRRRRCRGLSRSRPSTSEEGSHPLETRTSCPRLSSCHFDPTILRSGQIGHIPSDRFR
jgi:hypothetical protein